MTEQLLGRSINRLEDERFVRGRGCYIADLSAPDALHGVVVRSPQATQLAELIAGPDVTAEAVEPGLLEIQGLTAEQIGTEAAAHNIVLHELAPRQASLEEAFMVLTRDEIEFHASTSTSDDLEGALAA